ncbi:MAG: GGDEF domain-containing protein [Burkholderiales bacterium]
MELDPRTLIVASLLTAGLMGAVALIFATVRGATRVIGNWGKAMLVLAAGLLGLALRGAIPDWISIALANTAIIAALVLALRSLRVFLGSRPRDLLGWGLIVPMFVYLLVFSVIWPNNVARTIGVSMAICVIAFRGARLLRRRAPEHCRLSCRFTEMVFWAMLAVTAVRAVGTLVARTPDVMAPELINAATFLAYTGFIMVATLGVIWMEIDTLQAELVRSAHFDSLTGIYNRGTFLAEFEREVSRSARGGAAFSLAIFDLDRFKQLNDRFGHPAGDQVLKAFADVLRAGIRKHDTVGRYGGEEFALLMPQTGKETAVRVAERIRRALEALGISVELGRIDVTVSAGVATYGVDGDDWDGLLSAADTALYEAKNSGRNRVATAHANESPAAAGLPHASSN